MGLCAVPGYKMSLHQAAAQFRLYTGVNAPLEVMERSIIRLLQAS
jgi:shikimate 5-dehydrogenase